jgi:hypothetical protein
VDYVHRVRIDVALDAIDDPSSCMVIRADGFPGDLTPRR